MVSELEGLKARAKEWRDPTIEDVVNPRLLADLDHAIAIIESLDVSRYKEQRDQARADVLKLRDDIRDIHVNVLHQGLDCNEHCESLADTEHYEQYRKESV